MLDAWMRRLIDPPLQGMARPLVSLGIHPNWVTVTGLVIGLGSIPLLAFQYYQAALGVILINRVLDGLDGAIARRGIVSDFGGYLDIVCDFLFYSGVVFGFALADPDSFALPAAFLIYAFVGTGVSFLAFAILAAKRGVSTQIRGRKSFYYIGGLTEGTETILLFTAFCLFPQNFPVLAYIFGSLCWVTTGTRVAQAFQTFRR